MNKVLSVINQENKIVYIMGDFNINLLNVDKHVPSSEFIEIMYSFSLYPLINKPTRVTDKSATLIDNIFCNNMVDTSMFNAIFYTDITDHFPVFCISVKNNEVENQHYTTIRQYTEDNISKFCSNIQTVGWDSVTTCTDCQSAYSEFYKTFITLCDKHFPPVKIKTTYRNRKSWLTVGLKKSIKIKNKLFLKSRKTPTSNNIINYKKYRNKLNSLLRQSERDYYDSLLSENKQDLKKNWNVIKQVINKKKSTQICQNFKINNCNFTDNFTINRVLFKIGIITFCNRVLNLRESIKFDKYFYPL